MATNQTFVDFVTPVPADWLNNVNFVVNQYPFSPLPVVTSIANLRLTTTSQTVILATGYYTALDGGGGQYVYDSTDTTSADNGGTIIVDGNTRRWKLQYTNNAINIKQFGAKVDGVTDDSTAIQNCINWFANNKGGTVFFPAGTTLINAGITVSVGGITLQGIGWQEYSGTEGSPGGIGTNASWILTTTTTNTPVTFANTIEHGIIRDIAFQQTQPADVGGWTPTVYPATIAVEGSSTSGGSVLMERLFLWNTYYGIRIGTTGNFTGRVTMKHIWGSPISLGINMIASSDTILIDDVHFWPFDLAATNKNAWTQANGTGIGAVRSDNFILTNSFIYGRNFGLTIGSSSDGGSENFTVSNTGFDSCTVGIVCNATGGVTQGQISNVYVYCSSVGEASSSGNGLSVLSAPNCMLDIVNFKGKVQGGSVIYLAGTADVSVVNCWAYNWNQSNTGQPAFNVGTGCTLTLGGRLRTTGTGTVESGGGTYNATHVN